MEFSTFAKGLPNLSILNRSIEVISKQSQETDGRGQLAGGRRQYAVTVGRRQIPVS